MPSLSKVLPAMPRQPRHQRRRRATAPASPFRRVGLSSSMSPTFARHNEVKGPKLWARSRDAAYEVVVVNWEAPEQMVAVRPNRPRRESVDCEGHVTLCAQRGYAS
jgi:hypothetical protein